MTGNQFTVQDYRDAANKAAEVAAEAEAELYTQLDALPPMRRRHLQEVAREAKAQRLALIMQADNLEARNIYN